MHTKQQYIYTEKPLQFIQMEDVVFMYQVITQKLSFIFHLIITHPTITLEEIESPKSLTGLQHDIVLVRLNDDCPWWPALVLSKIVSSLRSQKATADKIPVLLLEYEFAWIKFACVQHLIKFGGMSFFLAFVSYWRKL